MGQRTPRPYDGMTDDDLMNLAKQTIAAWDAEPLGSIERAMKSAAHESVMNELKRRLGRRINIELGLSDIDEYL